MSMQDPIADMFCRIKNAQAVKRTVVSVPFSKVKLAIAKLLKEEGYIDEFQYESSGFKRSITLSLKYHLSEPVISTLKRVSRPGLRIYRSATHLPKVLDGLGVAIISTSKGLMSDRQARALGQGGEVIAVIG